jgi:DEAD/DEAH box helicase domain-containing protein
MLPSILAHELQEGTRRFLVTAFEPADRYFRGIVSRFVETPGTLNKGPYLHGRCQ